MNTTTSSSRGSTSSPYSFPDPEEVEVGLLGFIKTHIILLGIFYFLSAVGMLIIVSYGPVIQLQHHWTLSFYIIWDIHNIVDNTLNEIV